MGCSSAVLFLNVAFLLVVCVSVSAEGSEVELPAVTKEAAQQAVVAAETSINGVRQGTQSNIDSATLLLEKVKLFKKQVDEAATEAQAEKEDEKTKAIIAEIKMRSETVGSWYENALTELESANISMVQLLVEAKTMEDACKIIMPATDKDSNNYTEEHNSATEIKTKADLFTTNINDASNKISGVQSKAGTMEENAKEAQIKTFHVSVIIAHAKIETMIGEADHIMQTTAIKKKEVNDIIEEIEELKGTAPSGSIDSIDKLYKKAEAELNKATSAFQRAETANGAINQQKELAEAALTNVQKTDIDLTEAKQEANKAKSYITNAELNVLQIKSEVKTAESSATNAKGVKEEIVQALLKAKKKPSTEQSKETTEANLSVVDGTDSLQKDTTIQPIITDTKQPSSKDPPSQSNKTYEELKDALSKVTQNVPTTALTGESAPAPGAKNDSAMTVSVPLLVALIASAVLQ